MRIHRNSSVAARCGLTVVAILLVVQIAGPVRGAEPKPASIPEGLRLKAPAIPEHIVGTVRALNESLSRNLKPEENAAVWLVRVFGGEAFEPEVRQASLDMLGVEAVSKTGPRFLFLEEYVESLGVARGNVRREALELQAAIDEASLRVWQPQELPAVDAFLNANQAGLDGVVAAADLSRYFVPVLPTDESEQLFSASRAIERRLPFVVRVLTARALRNSAGRNFASVTADFMAGHRLAALLAEGSPFDVSVGKAGAADAAASFGEYALLKSGNLTGGQAEGLRKSLEKVPRIRGSAFAADRGERANLHQEIELLQRDRNSVRDFFDLPQPEAAANGAEGRLPTIDWKLARERADEIQNRIVQALETRDRQRQNELFDQLDRDHDKWDETSDDTTKELAANFAKRREAASRWVGETMARSLRPLYRQRRISDDRAAVRRDMVLVGLALVSFQRDHGEFPASLAHLAPRYLQAVPDDSYSDAPFAYVRESKDRARLISWGPNRGDDAGKTFNDDQAIELR
ncbi:MAG: hypothetical protein HY290_24780 [Planctomycetia bacterium]|nr:hypothetical protein [Planctomycetia bacterium]